VVNSDPSSLTARRNQFILTVIASTSSDKTYRPLGLHEPWLQNDDFFESWLPTTTFSSTRLRAMLRRASSCISAGAVPIKVVRDTMNHTLAASGDTRDGDSRRPDRSRDRDRRGRSRDRNRESNEDQRRSRRLLYMMRQIDPSWGHSQSRQEQSIRRSGQDLKGPGLQVSGAEIRWPLFPTSIPGKCVSRSEQGGAECSKARRQTDLRLAVALCGSFKIRFKPSTESSCNVFSPPG
jgi:hypothetical protein